MAPLQVHDAADGGDCDALKPPLASVRAVGSALTARAAVRTGDRRAGPSWRRRRAAARRLHAGPSRGGVTGR
eukprot:4849931-Prymnesium_polylepis.1